MDKMPKLRECGTHERQNNRNNSNDELQRLCEACGRTYYVCDMCRSVRNIEAPLSICIKCAPAVKTLKPILDRKDAFIQELSERVKRAEGDNKGFHEVNESLRKQHGSLRKQTEENKTNLKMYRDEYMQMKRAYDDLKQNYERLVIETRPKDRFLKDMKLLMTTPTFNDISINVGNEVYAAHKCILSARSEKFKKLLEPVIDPADKKHQRKLEVNNLQFTDVNESVMPIFMNYLYTGELGKKVSPEQIGELIKLAEKFELNELRDLALTHTEQQIDRNTVIPILVQAHHYNNERLKNKCIDFINRENMDLINSPQWVKLKRDNPGAALDLYEARMKNGGGSAKNDSSSTASKKNGHQNGSGERDRENREKEMRDREYNQLHFASMHNMSDMKSPRKRQPVQLNKTESNIGDSETNNTESAANESLEIYDDNSNNNTDQNNTTKN